MAVLRFYILISILVALAYCSVESNTSTDGISKDELLSKRDVLQVQNLFAANCENIQEEIFSVKTKLTAQDQQLQCLVSSLDETYELLNETSKTVRKQNALAENLENSVASFNEKLAKQEYHTQNLVDTLRNQDEKLEELSSLMMKVMSKVNETGASGTKDCVVTRPADLFVLANPGGTVQALQAMDHIIEKTSDINNQIRVSYLMEACDDAINVPMDDIDSHCDRFKELQKSSEEKYLALIDRLIDQAKANRQAEDFHRGAQVALMFIDRASMESSPHGLIIAATALTINHNIDVVVVDLGVQKALSSYLTYIRRDGEVVRFKEGELKGQETTMQDLLDKTCQGLNREAARSERPGAHVPPS